jgi:hypothetical protein
VNESRRKNAKPWSTNRVLKKGILARFVKPDVSQKIFVEPDVSHYFFL